MTCYAIVQIQALKPRIGQSSSNHGVKINHVQPCHHMTEGLYPVLLCYNYIMASATAIWAWKKCQKAMRPTQLNLWTHEPPV